MDVWMRKQQELGIIILSNSRRLSAHIRQLNYMSNNLTWVEEKMDWQGHRYFKL